MLFLKKIVEHRKTDSSMIEHVNDSSLQSSSGDCETSEVRKAKKIKKIKIDSAKLTLSL